MTLTLDSLVDIFPHTDRATRQILNFDLLLNTDSVLE